VSLGSLARVSRTLPLRERARLLAVWLLLGLSRIAIAILPFRVIRRVLGEHRATSAPQERELDARRRARALHLASHVGVAAAHSPWRADCYPQALTGRLLLTMARIPHTVSFGVRRADDGLRAHAWVHAGDVTVTGGTGDEYTEVAAFTWSPRRVSA